MKYHATLRLNKEGSNALKCYSEDVINKVINNIASTTGYNITKINDSNTSVMIYLEIDTDTLVEGHLNSMQVFDSIDSMSSTEN